MEPKRSHGDDDNAASRSLPAPSMGSIDAQDADASLDKSDSALSFLDGLEDLNDLVESLVDDSVFLEPAPLISASQTTPLGVDASVIVGAGGGSAEIQSHENEKPAKTAGTTKDRQKQELEYLRSQVVELEAELAQLKSSPDSSPSTLVEPSTWEKIAKRQSEAKQKATIENARLRELLEGQLKVARSLEKVLKKRALCEPSDGFTERKRLRPTREMDPSAILEEIRGRIHLLFDDVDAVMEECGLSVIYTDIDDAQATARATTNNAICMELMVAKVLPFTVEQVADAMWQCTSGNIELQTGYIDASPRSEYTCDLHAAVEIKLRRAEALVQVHGVGARLTEAERSIIVFEAAGATQGTLFARNPIRCRERGYVVIEKNVMMSGDVALPSTIVKACVHLWPESASSSGGEKTAGSVHFGSFIDLVIGSYNPNTKIMLQIVENILLEQSLKQTSTHGANE